MRRKHGTRRRSPRAIAGKTPIRIRGQAARPAGVYSIDHPQHVISRLTPKVVLAVDHDVGIAGAGPQREPVRIAGAPYRDAREAPVRTKAQAPGAARIGLVAEVAG